MSDTPITAWGDDVALSGPDAPKNDGSIKHLIGYLLTVHKRFGNTGITCNLQWGASAMWKRDALRAELATLTAEVERKQAALVELIACKDLKEMAEAIDTSGSPSATVKRRLMLVEYDGRKHLAWTAARRAVLPVGGEG